MQSFYFKLASFSDALFFLYFVIGWKLAKHLTAFCCGPFMNFLLTAC